MIAGGIFLWRHLPARVPTTQTPVASAPQDDLRREVEKIAEKIRSAHLNSNDNFFADFCKYLAALCVSFAFLMFNICPF